MVMQQKRPWILFDLCKLNVKPFPNLIQECASPWIFWWWCVSEGTSLRVPKSPMVFCVSFITQPWQRECNPCTKATRTWFEGKKTWDIHDHICRQALEEVWTDVQKMSRTIRNHWNHLWLQVCRTCIPTTFISFGEKYESVSGSRWWSYRCTASMRVKFNFSRNISIFSMFQHLGRFHDRFRRVQLLSCPLLAQIDSRSMPLWKQSVDFFVRKIPKSKSFEIHKSTSSCTEQGDCTGAAQSGRLAMGAL